MRLRNARAAHSAKLSAVRPIPGRHTHEEQPMKILVAADGSSYTKRMLAYLAAHDEWLGSRC